jgi:hypothetical protein
MRSQNFLEKKPGMPALPKQVKNHLWVRLAACCGFFDKQYRMP